jgi:hypothetical protein
LISELGLSFQGNGNLCTMKEFVEMVYLFFQKVEMAMCLNNAIINNFKIKKNVKKRCPFAPYLFCMVGELVFNIDMIMMQENTKEIKGIKLP